MNKLNKYLFFFILGWGSTLFSQQDISIQSQVNNQSAQLGDTVTVYVSVHNDSQQDITNLKITLQVSAGLSFLEANAPNATNFNSNTNIWLIGNALNTMTDSLTLIWKGTVTERGILSVISEITAMSGQDIDSVPNNGNAFEDDWANSCVSVPIKIFPHNQDTILASASPNLSGEEWYKQTSNGLQFLSNSPQLAITEAGIYQLYANQNNCEFGECCPLIIENNITISNIQCNNSGTSDNILDDVFSFDLEVFGAQNDWWAIIQGDTITGQNEIKQTYSNYLITDGDIDLTIWDSQTGLLVGNALVSAPFPCSDCNAESTIYLCPGEEVLLKPQIDTNIYTHFQWFKNAAAIAGAVFESFTVTETGVYEFRASSDADFECFSELGAPVSVVFVTPPQPQDVTVTFCPFSNSVGNVSANDSNLEDPIYRLVSPTSIGNVTIETNGIFEYAPSGLGCGTDQFSYEVCNQTTGCCDTAICFINLSDTIAPTLQNVPVDLTLSCDEVIPEPASVFAFDQCPGIYVLMEETISQSDSLYCSYSITRTWTATDLCGNSSSESQKITVQDWEPPSIFKVHTLPSGQKLIGGIAQAVSHHQKKIVFPFTFKTPPLVFTQTISTNESIPVVSRIKEVTATGFTLSLQEEEAADGVHTWEAVAWVAIESGVQDSGQLLELGILNLTDTWQSIPFNNTYSASPAVFTQTQTTNEIDPFSIRYRNKTMNNVEVSIHEETSNDSELSHAAEQTAFWIADTLGTFLNDENQTIGEFGIARIRQTWATISLKNQYQNPIIIGGTVSRNGADAATVRIRNVQNNSFEMRVEEWDYLDGNHAYEEVSYVVIEGSLPGNLSGDCLDLENRTSDDFDMVAGDNCGTTIFNFQNNWADTTGQNLILNRTWTVSDNCNNTQIFTQNITCPHAVLSLKAVLQGALQNNNDSHLMRDDLRELGLIPLNEPYSNLEGFEHKGSGGEETISQNLLNDKNENSTVDWVFIEIRDADDPMNILETRSAILQRDGDISDINGDTILHFYNTPIGDYFVSIRHRNHLGIMTPISIELSESAPQIDLSKNLADGFFPQKNINGTQALWAGNTNKDRKVIYQGPQNDIFSLLVKIMESPQNTDFLANYIHVGYETTDLNLDGKTIYQGPNNERTNLLFNVVLVHPNNSNSFSNFIVEEQLPEND